MLKEIRLDIPNTRSLHHIVPRGIVSPCQQYSNVMGCMILEWQKQGDIEVIASLIIGAKALLRDEKMYFCENLYFFQTSFRRQPRVRELRNIIYEVANYLKFDLKHKSPQSSETAETYAYYA